MIIYVSAASRQEAEFQGEAGQAEKAEVTSPEAIEMQDSKTKGKTQTKRLQKMSAQDVDPTPAKKAAAKKDKKKRKGEEAAAEQSSDLRKHFKAK